MLRGAAAFVGTPVAGALVRNSGSILGRPKAYEGMSLMVSALLVAATVTAAWQRVEAMTGPSGAVRRGWKI